MQGVILTHRSTTAFIPADIDKAMTTEEPSGFEVVDKRHTRREETPAEEPAPEVSTESAESQEGQQLPPLTIQDRLLMCIDILHQGAWISLGLIADPSTGKVEKDLDAARRAIDAVAFLADQAEPLMDDGGRRELKRIVADLRLNYVRQAQK
ncbi:MAG: DUF1844 domain-containing protein [Chthonomonadales bacterium]